MYPFEKNILKVKVVKMKNKNNTLMGIINFRLNTVEVFDDIKRMQDMLECFGNENIEELHDTMIVLEEEIQNIIDVKEFVVVGFYDSLNDIYYDEIPFTEYQEVKRKIESKKQGILCNIAIDVLNIQYILNNKGWIFEIENYLLNNGYEKREFKRFGNTEIYYCKDDVEVKIINDLEVVFYSGFSVIGTIEKRNNLVLVYY